VAISEHILLALWVARNAARKVRAGGTLLFMGGTGARRPARGLAIVSVMQRREYRRHVDRSKHLGSGQRIRRPTQARCVGLIGMSVTFPCRYKSGNETLQSDSIPKPLPTLPERAGVQPAETASQSSPLEARAIVRLP
jgi:hypothetical protein